MQWYRPVFLIGHGCRAAGAEELMPAFMNLGIPVLSSWQAADLVDNSHPAYFGRPGLYGQRCANKVLAAADFVVAIGNRCSVWNVGYEGIKAQMLYCDIDPAEAKRFPSATWVDQDAYDYIEGLIEEPLFEPRPDWMGLCQGWRKQYPWLEAAHADLGDYINAYGFTEELEKHFAPDEIIVTDMGTALCCAHQVLSLKPPQRLMTSGGLGEMGCALPAAIGAAFATGKSVLCLTCDGGMMLNLQELQTIVHHQLPIRIIVYSNDGYLMLKHTQKDAGMTYSGVDKATGVSCPSFRKLAQALDIPAGDVFTWKDYESAIPQLFAAKGPALVEFHMHPEQPLVPKLSYKIVDGKKQYDPFDKLSPEVA